MHIFRAGSLLGEEYPLLVAFSIYLATATDVCPSDSLLYLPLLSWIDTGALVFCYLSPCSIYTNTGASGAMLLSSRVWYFRTNDLRISLGCHFCVFSFSSCLFLLFLPFLSTSNLSSSSPSPSHSPLPCSSPLLLSPPPLTVPRIPEPRHL